MPEVLSAGNGRREEAGASELVALYPDRASVPRETLLQLLTEAQDCIDVLVFSGTFFAQTQPRVASMLADRSTLACRYDSVSATRPGTLLRSETVRKGSAEHWRRRSARV